MTPSLCRTITDAMKIIQEIYVTLNPRNNQKLHKYITELHRFLTERKNMMYDLEFLIHNIFQSYLMQSSHFRINPQIQYAVYRLGLSFHDPNMAPLFESCGKTVETARQILKQMIIWGKWIFLYELTLTEYHTYKNIYIRNYCRYMSNNNI